MKKPAAKDLKSLSNKKIEKKPQNTGIPSWIWIGAVMLLTLGIYTNSLKNGILTFDDNEYFQNYPEVTSLSWESVKMYFTNYYVIMYQPLPVLTFALNFHFSALNTFPMHFVNLLFHLVNIVLVFKLIQSLTSNTNVALVVSLLFAVHPMNVEAVSWISARSSSMYTAFYLSSLIFYIQYLKSQTLKPILLTGIFFVLSLFCKAQAVTLPVVLLLFDFLYSRKLVSRKVILEKLPFFILSLVFGIITIMNTGTMSNITKGMMISYNPLDIFFIVCYSISFYLIKLFFPVNLCAIYVYPPKPNGFLPWEYYASVIVICLIIYGLWRARNNRMVLFCSGFFLVTIAINIQLIPSRLFVVSERYGYMPYLGLFLLISMMFVELKSKNLVVFNRYFPMVIVIFSVFVLFSSFTVVQRNKIWNNDLVFLTDVIDKNPPVGYIYRAYGNRGLAYKFAGKYAEAAQDFTESIKLDPTDARNYFNRGLTYEAMKNYSAALNDFTKAIELEPDKSMLYNSRSQVRFNLNDIDGAEADCKKCLELDPVNIDALNTLANITFNRNQFEACEQYLTKAIAIKPDFAVALKNRGLLYLKLNRSTDACSDFVTASNYGSEEAKQLKGQYCK